MRFVRLPQAVRTPARATVAVALMAIMAICAAPASAQNGNGLYEPFPDPVVRSNAQAYVEEAVGKAVPTSDLNDGRFLRGLPASTTSGGRAARGAGIDDGSDGLLTWPGAIALLLVGFLAGTLGRGNLRRSDARPAEAAR